MSQFPFLYVFFFSYSSQFHSSIIFGTSFQTFVFYFIRVFGRWSSTLFLNFYKCLFPSFSIEHVIVWMYFSLFTSQLYQFECGSPTHGGTQLVHVIINSSCSKFSPFFKFCKYNSFYEWHGFLPALIIQRFDSQFSFSSIGLTFRQDVSNFLLVQRLDCFGWLYYPWTLNILMCMYFCFHWLDEYALSFISSLVQMNLP